MASFRGVFLFVVVFGFVASASALKCLKKDSDAKKDGPEAECPNADQKKCMIKLNDGKYIKNDENSL